MNELPNGHFVASFLVLLLLGVTESLLFLTFNFSSEEELFIFFQLTHSSRFILLCLSNVESLEGLMNRRKYFLAAFLLKNCSKFMTFLLIDVK